MKVLAMTCPVVSAFSLHIELDLRITMLKG